MFFSSCTHCVSSCVCVRCCVDRDIGISRRKALCFKASIMCQEKWNLYPEFQRVKKKDKFLIKSLFSKSQSCLLLLIQSSLARPPPLQHNNNDTRLRQGERKIKETNLYRQENENILLILLKLCVLLKLWVRDEKKGRAQEKYVFVSILWAIPVHASRATNNRSWTFINEMKWRESARARERETRKKLVKAYTSLKVYFYRMQKFQIGSR